MKSGKATTASATDWIRSRLETPGSTMVQELAEAILGTSAKTTEDSAAKLLPGYLPPARGREMSASEATGFKALGNLATLQTSLKKKRARPTRASVAFIG